MASSDVAARLVSALAILAIGGWFAVRSVLHAEYPVLRAIEAILAVVALMIVTFASIYLVTSTSNPNAFSESLDHTGALYFALTTSTTIGFGDITPVSNPARIEVMCQMAANVIVIGVGARVLIGTARQRSGR